MTCPDFIEFLCDASAHFLAAQETEWWQVLSWLAAIVMGLVGFVRLFIAVASYLLKRQKRKEDTLLEQAVLVKSFSAEEIKSATLDYVVPNCSNIDPSNQDDLRNTVGVRQDVFEALYDELKSGARCHVLVLADSGMGKTTLLLNLWNREQKKSINRRNRMALVPLGQGNAIEQIKGIADQRNTVLLLDALDEDTKAIEDVIARMDEIMEWATDFKAVVMTCRTQFFPSENSVPRDTGVKRVSARRAGVPTFYQWRTVYLLPFNSKQIQNYIKATIPWHKLGQRRKAYKIIGDISDLAARPMLTALIPELASTKTEVQGLWDLYSFMVDSWLRRESSWIEPSALNRLSKVLAVDLVLKRAERSSERISLDEMLAVLSLSNESVDNWKLTGRSLLNRDSDGHYKFAHRSIMEFLFIQAFVEGDDRCKAVLWTDMMCQLFLSWGNSASHNIDRARQILSSDLRMTKLFPLSITRESPTRLDASWVKQMFSERPNSGQYSKLPSHWRLNVSRIIDNGDLVRVYDFAEGIVWQIQKTIAIEERGERDIYKVNRQEHRGEDLLKNNWMVSELSELRWLIEILCTSDQLKTVLDERELYWLADTDGRYCTVARIRTNPNSESVVFPNIVLINSITSTIGSVWFAIDVYKADVRGKQASNLVALPIMVFQGDAEAIWHCDAPEPQHRDWAVSLLRASTPHTRFKKQNGAHE